MTSHSISYYENQLKQQISDKLAGKHIISLQLLITSIFIKHIYI